MWQSELWRPIGSLLDKDDNGMSTQDTILIYDGDEDILDLLEDYLGRFDFEIITANSRQEALEKIKNRDITVFVLGARDAEGDEIKLVSEVSRLNGDIKTLYLCAFPTVYSLLATIRAGVYEVVVKPFRLEQLEAAVKRALAAPRYNGRIKELEEKITVLQNRFDMADTNK